MEPLPPLIAPLMSAKDFLQYAAIVGVVVAALKVAFAVARFFIELSNGVRQLTEAVEKLTGRFDQHTEHVDARLAEMGERVAGLESWREAEAG